MRARAVAIGRGGSGKPGRISQDGRRAPVVGCQIEQGGEADPTGAGSRNMVEFVVLVDRSYDPEAARSLDKGAWAPVKRAWRTRQPNNQQRPRPRAHRESATG